MKNQKERKTDENEFVFVNHVFSPQALLIEIGDN